MTCLAMGRYSSGGCGERPNDEAPSAGIQSAGELQYVLGEYVALDLARAAVDRGGARVIEGVEKIRCHAGDVVHAGDDAVLRPGLDQELRQPLPGLHGPDLEHGHLLPERLAAFDLLDE